MVNAVFEEMRLLDDEVEKGITYRNARTGLYNFETLEGFLRLEELMTPKYERVFADLKRRYRVVDNFPKPIETKHPSSDSLSSGLSFDGPPSDDFLFYDSLPNNPSSEIPPLGMSDFTNNNPLTIDDFVVEVRTNIKDGYLNGAETVYKRAKEFAGESPDTFTENWLQTMRSDIFEGYYSKIADKLKDDKMHDAGEVYWSAEQFAMRNPGSDNPYRLQMMRLNILNEYFSRIEERVEEGNVQKAKTEYWFAKKFAGESQDQETETCLQEMRCDILHWYSSKIAIILKEDKAGEIELRDDDIKSAENAYRTAKQFAGENPDQDTADELQKMRYALLGGYNSKAETEIKEGHVIHAIEIRRRAYLFAKREGHETSLNRLDGLSKPIIDTIH